MSEDDSSASVAVPLSVTYRHRKTVQARKKASSECWKAKKYRRRATRQKQHARLLFRVAPQG